MITIERRPVELTPAERRTVLDLLEEHDQDLARSADRGVDAVEIHQPFFRRHRVLELELAGVFPAREAHVALADPRSGRLLSGRIDEVNALVDRDPPPRISDAGTARIYGNICDGWSTAASYYGELVIDAFDEIPFSDNLLEPEKVLMDGLREQLGPHIGPQRVDANDDGFALTTWLVSRCQLIRRVLGVHHTGHLVRTDTVYDSELPVPEGRIWGVVAGRLVPVG